MESERDRLVGVLAVQLGFASPQQIMAATKAEAAVRRLAEQLEQSGVIERERRELLEAIVEAAIEAHGGDASQTLASFGAESLASRADSAREDELSVTDEHPGRYGLRDPGTHEPVDNKGFAEIARGGIGRILMAFDEHIGRDVAIKELLPGRSGTVPHEDSPARKASGMVARFLREARVTGQLEHPNIVPVYEVGRREDDTLYYTMKIVRGRTLSDALSLCDNLDDRLELLGHFVDVCQAIAYAHSRGVIHRDIKPHNVMVGEFGETVLLDWGLAKVRGKEDLRGNEIERGVELLVDTDETMVGATIGTPAYMSPEQAAGKVDDIDEQSDVFSLGALLHQILTGRTPHRADDAFEMVKLVRAQQAPKVRDTFERAPVELASICDKALCFDKEGRYASARDLARDINAYLTGGRVRAYRYGTWELASRFVLKHKAPFAVGALAAVFLVVVGVASYLRVTDERDRAQVAEKQASAQRDRAESTLADALAQKAGIVGSAQEAMLLSAKALTYAERPLARGEYAGAVNQPRPRTRWFGRRGVRCPVVLASPAGAWVACVPDGRENEVAIWDVESGTPLAGLEEPGLVSNSLAFVSESTIAVARESGEVVLWDIDEQSVVRRIALHDSSIQCVAVTTDGRELWGGADDGTLVSIDLATDHVRQRARLDCHGVFVMPMPRDAADVVVACHVPPKVLVWKRGQPEGAVELTSQSDGLMLAWMTPDGQRIVVSGESRLQIFEAGSRELLHEVEFPSGQIQEIVLTSDSKRVVAVGRDGVVRVVGMNGVVEKEIQAHHGGMQSAALLGRSNLVTAGRSDGTLRIWDLEREAEIARLDGHAFPITSLHFLDDGRRLMSSTGYGDVRIWNSGTGERQRLLFHPRAAERSSAVAPVTERTYVHGLTNGNAFTVSMETGELIREMEPIASGIRDVAVVEGGAKLIWLAGDGRIGLWDAATGRQLDSPLARATSVQAMAVSPDGGILATSGMDARLSFWELPALRRVFTGSARSPNLVSLSFSADGHLLAGGATERFVYLWSVPDGKSLGALAGYESGIVQVGFLPGSNDELISVGNDFTVRLWDAVRHSQLARVDLGVGVSAMALADGVVALGLVDGTVRGLELDGRASPVLRGHEATVTAIAFSADGERLISTGHDGTIRSWELLNGSCAVTQLPGDTVARTALSSAGDRLLIERRAGELALIDTATGVPRRQLGTSGYQRLSATAVSPDGAWVAFDDKHRVALWSTATGRVSYPEVPKTQTILGFAFRHDSSQLALSLVDGRGDPYLWLVELPGGTARPVTLWIGAPMLWSPDDGLLALASGRAVRVMSPEGSVEASLYGHGSDVRSLAFSPDSQYLATVEIGRVVHVWNIATEREVARLPNTVAAVSPYVPVVAFSPDGQTLATVMDDDSIRLWDMTVLETPAEELLAAAEEESGMKVIGASVVTDPEKVEPRFVKLP